MDEPLVRYDGTGTTSRRWLIADERGSIVAETNASGAAVQVNTYGAWGEPGNANTGRFGYTGQVFLGEVGLYHYKARAYNPEIGRFLQTDPIGVAGGMNLYEYAGSDPINFVDPMGTEVAPVEDVIEIVGVRLRGPGQKAYDMWLEQFYRSIRAAAFGGAGQGQGGGGGQSSREADLSWTDCYELEGEFSLGAQVGGSVRSGYLSLGGSLDAGTYRNDVLTGEARLTQGLSAEFGLRGMENAFYSSSTIREAMASVPTDALDFVRQAHDSLSAPHPFSGDGFVQSNQFSAPLELGFSAAFIAGVSFSLRYVC